MDEPSRVSGTIVWFGPAAISFIQIERFKKMYVMQQLNYKKRFSLFPSVQQIQACAMVLFMGIIFTKNPADDGLGEKNPVNGFLFQLSFLFCINLY